MANKSLAPIVRWSTEHETIVALHIGQKSNEEIAKYLKRTPVHISHVLSDPKAREIIHTAALKIRSLMMDSLVDGLAELASSGLKRIKETIDFPDFDPGSDAKKHQDRLAFDLAKLVYTNNTEAIEQELPLDAAMAKRIAEAIEASTAADELIKEGQFEVVK